AEIVRHLIADTAADQEGTLEVTALDVLFVDESSFIAAWVTCTADNRIVRALEFIPRITDVAAQIPAANGRRSDNDFRNWLDNVGGQRDGRQNREGNRCRHTGKKSFRKTFHRSAPSKIRAAKSRQKRRVRMFEGKTMR